MKSSIQALTLLASAVACPLLDKVLEKPAATTAPLSVSDVMRASTARPSEDSHVYGESAREAFSKMNDFLQNGAAKTQACEEFDHSSLNDLARVLYHLRKKELDAVYQLANDRRKMHFDTLDYKERLWAEEGELSITYELHAVGTSQYNATRDGKCAEIVMWYIHHLSQPQRVLLAEVEDFVLPLMPNEVASKLHTQAEYDQQIGCTSCHVPIHIPGTPPISPIPDKNGTGPQYPETCPNGPDGNPTVWYNRQKRCDWDYEPFCKPCEGVGGMVWGPGEHDWNEMPCTVVGTPDQVPESKRVVPIWPLDFTVQEYAALTFPGRDPCKVKFKNSTYSLYFDTRLDGPHYHTVGHTGPSGPSPFPGSSWAQPSGNFWNTINYGDNKLFCVCIGNVDPVVQNAFTGPLRYDFASDAKYVGREKIVPEYFNTPVIADHWAKGPHHFWMDISTGFMLREWQPFNGLQTYYDWNATKPDPKEMAVPGLCTSGILHFNVSCKLPAPEL